MFNRILHDLFNGTPHDGVREFFSSALFIFNVSKFFSTFTVGLSTKHQTLI